MLLLQEKKTAEKKICGKMEKALSALLVEQPRRCHLSVAYVCVRTRACMCVCYGVCACAYFVVKHPIYILLIACEAFRHCGSLGYTSAQAD